MSPEVMPHPPKQSHRAMWTAAIAGVVIVIILAVAVGGYLFSRTSVFALHGVRYLAGPFESRTLYQVGWRGPEKVSLPVPGRVTDYARENGHEAAIAMNANGGQDAYAINGASAVALTSDGGVKSSLDVSSDGSLVAYAIRTATTSTSTPSAFYAPQDWAIMLSTVSSKQSALVGVGYGPHFFAKDGVQYLSYTSPLGLHIVNLSTNANQDIAIDRGAAPNGFFTATVSPDGAYAAVPLLSGYMLYALQDNDGSFSVSPSAALPLDSNVVAFSSDGLVSMANTVTDTSTLLRLSSEQAPGAIRKGLSYPFQRIYKVIP